MKKRRLQKKKELNQWYKAEEVLGYNGHKSIDEILKSLGEGGYIEPTKTSSIHP